MLILLLQAMGFSSAGGEPGPVPVTPNSNAGRRRRAASFYVR